MKNNMLSFSYIGTEFPTQEMISWFINQEPENTGDLNAYTCSSNQERDFFEEFKEELMPLSYFQMLDVFGKLSVI